MTVRVLFIGGMDSSGGAGLLRDCATAAQCGITARVAVTAVTAQTDRAVTAVHPIAPEVVAAQIRAAGQVAAVKIGMLCSAAIVNAVAGTLPSAPCILDPVLCSSSGHDLIDTAGTDLLLGRLLPKVDLLTPNLPELAMLARRLGVIAPEERTRVTALLERGCRAVLVKGGHAVSPDTSEDRLYLPNAEPVVFGAPRIDATLRGTGCQLASAIAAHLSLGNDLQGAVAAAKSRVQHSFWTAASDKVAISRQV